MQKYNLVVCGATFDHFHDGHKEFIRFALDQGKKVLLGLTSDAFGKEKRQETEIEPYQSRKSSVINYLREQRAEENVEILPIDTIFIPPQWESLPIQAIIVSKDSLAGAKMINHKRKTEGKQPLEMVECPIVMTEDGMPISSVRIRKGEITREGKLFISPLWQFPLRLTLSLRKKLKQPFGNLITDVDTWFKRRSFDPSKIITVGDVVTASFNNYNIGQRISVVDFFVARKRKFSNIKEHGFSGSETKISTDNPAGTLTSSTFKACKDIFTTVSSARIVMIVEGEEDLVVLPFVLTAPLGYHIYYGQPDRGIVEVKITEQRKKETYSIINQFK